MAKKVSKKAKAPKTVVRPAEKPIALMPELLDVSKLKKHPQNYRKHGPDQLSHIKASIRKNGFYKNVIVAKDYTLLAGHGAEEAARELGLARIPGVRLMIDPSSPQALKILTGDNEVSRLAEVDDRTLSEILKGIAEVDVNELIGTGFDDKQLANLVYVTRDSKEIPTFDAAAEYVGMPSYDEKDPEKDTEPLLVITFKNQSDREKFIEEKKIKIRDKRGGRKWSTVWPYVERNDLKSVKFDPEEE